MAFYHFLVLGEEKRQYYLAQMLKKEGHEVMEAMSLIAPIRYEIKKIFRDGDRLCERKRDSHR